MRKYLLPVFLTLATILVATLIVTAPELQAEEGAAPSPAAPEEPAMVEAMADVASSFLYQGLLEENGTPVTGTRVMSFTLYEDPACSAPVGTPTTLPSVLVVDGVFNVEVAVDSGVMDGQARWIEVEVGGTSVGCQEIVPVPYALSLRPGAVVAGAEGIRVTATGGASTGVSAIGAYAGISGTASISTGVGVVGHASATSGSPIGVRGEAAASNGIGGYFSNSSFSSVGPDLVLGSNASNDEGNLWSDPDEPSSDIYLRSNDEVWVQLDTNNDENAEFRVRNGTNTTVFRVDESGNSFASGTKSAVVETATGDYRRVYAVESPIVVFEDFGSAEMVDGAVTVEIDSLFARTVNLEVDYQVFLTPVDGWAALYVTNKRAGSFEVRDAEGKASLTFDYRIVARRQGYEDVRLEAAPVPVDGSTQETDDAGR